MFEWFSRPASAPRRRLFRSVAVALLVMLLPASALAQIQVGSGVGQHVPFVTIKLGPANIEQGLSLFSLAADGATSPVDVEGISGRTTAGAAGEWQYFYLGIDDTYMYGGKNEVAIFVNYFDRGTQPIYLDYDSYDNDRPDAQTQDVTHKRVLLVRRTNTESWRTAQLNLDDARFINSQGGADLRIGSRDRLIITNVSIRRLATTFPPPPIKVFLDDAEIEFDVRPTIREGRVLVPLRAIFEALGAQVHWQPETQTIIASRPGRVLMLTIDHPIPFIDGQPGAPLDVAPQIIDGRTLVPLRFVGEAFGGLQVEWENDTRTVYMHRTRAPEPAGIALPPAPEPDSNGDGAGNDDSDGDSGSDHDAGDAGSDG